MLHSIIGWDCVLGAWSRIEGYPSDLNPNDPIARIPSESLFNLDGRLNPSITILGRYYLVKNNIPCIHCIAKTTSTLLLSIILYDMCACMMVMCMIMITRVKLHNICPVQVRE